MWEERWVPGISLDKLCKPKQQGYRTKAYQVFNSKVLAQKKAHHESTYLETARDALQLPNLKTRAARPIEAPSGIL